MNKKRLLGFLLVLLSVLWTAFILTRSMKPAIDSALESEQLLLLFQGVFPAMTDHFLRKLAHFSEFFLLGGLVGGAFAMLRRPAILWPLLCCALIAATDETIQLFFDGRSGEVKDVLLDTLGSLCALLLLWLLLYRRHAGKTETA